ncbi:MAG: hypothetical protein UU82_C0033G0007 [Candidatus Nomurabacteria bacterium GW2011_GWC2_41_8]|uniref:Uncharacterized protein n=2 Tax=Candidatus Nomuraibacteriota TaxID=1752729 RepID=A0A1F6YE17_9BACT|nr:MAG: hypothetical protein UU82_C0033G0007 [Candidatus Nomurabacteria bacterium GW2011_GWC2_41_8]OGI67095.1 MAG: hypothetical protein A2823_02450 [Candidatus Nomurabacteria bacterium RIFCSPHIGHO2_01_FULL_41_91]OGI81059.1 MAG: hypothetical protein A3D43_01655 [Candidatus Nomurabacteria bacterium RIFCSPHIGHO2_02_FULL_41_52]OGI84582.1 MAG: hypothetical protein A3F49_01920 [Candidatus Nomurabacteria bacterium RIFCSPHIGHO2_12_FULL_42_19]OGI93852.1 MAG: hypothetical protein A3A07_00580 [Candidatus 
MLIRVLKAPAEVRSAEAAFFSRLGIAVSFLDMTNFPWVIGVSEWSDDHIQLLAKFGVVVEVVETRLRPRPWLAGVDYVE